MKENWIKRNYKTIIRISYIIPILVAAGISIYHVISWYGITNPMSWAIYLSVGIEIAALSALAGMTAKMSRFVYVPFLIVTFIQVLGNIFASYQYIDITGISFNSWVELFNPIFESFGWVENGNLLEHRRILGILGGVFIPLISLSFLHLLISFNDKELEKIGLDYPTPKLPKDVAPTTPNAYTYKKNDTHIIPVEEILEEEKVVMNINTQKPVGGVNDYTKDVCTPEEVVISGKTKEYGIIDSQLEFNFDVVKPEIIVEEPLDDKLVENKKRKAVIPTGDVKRAEIPEVKDVQSRGFSVNIPKNNNSIGRVDNNKGSGIYYKRDKN